MATILVVEDEPEIREIVAEALADAGYQVIDACDGAEALEKLHACHPQVVLLDLMMPRMNGWQFRAAQRLDPDPEVAGVPVIVLSASGGVADLDAAEYIEKPFELERLLSAVRHQVHRA